MWWQIGLGAAALAFIALAGFAIRFLHAAQQTLIRSEAMLQQAQEQWNGTMQESQRLIRQSMVHMEEMRAKIREFERLFAAVQETGDAAYRVSRSVKAVSRTVEETLEEARRAVHNRREAVSELMEFTAAGMQLWQRWQSWRQTKSGALADDREQTERSERSQS